MTTFEAVKRAIGMALAPAFLLTALNALTTRLTWSPDRLRGGAQPGERAWLGWRSFGARRSVQLCAVPAFLVASQIMWTFSAALMGGQNGLLLSLAMIVLMAAMPAFVFETMLAEREPKE